MGQWHNPATLIVPFDRAHHVYQLELAAVEQLYG
jgi:hypothetical protein